MQSITFILTDNLTGGISSSVNLIAESLHENSDADISICVLSSTNINHNLKVPCFSLNSNRAINSIFRLHRLFRERRDTVFISSSLQLNLICCIIKRFFGHPKKLVVMEHTNPTWLVENYPTPYRKLLKQLMYWFYPAADRIVAVSEGATSKLKELFPKNITAISTIYNPICSQRVLELADADTKALPGREKRSYRFIGVGHLVEPKGFQVAIQALASEPLLDAELWLVGDGNYRKVLQQLAIDLGVYDRVVFHGHHNNPFPLLNACDCLVLPSFTESLPTVLLEAMCLNLRIISSDCDYGPREILEGGTYGRLVAVNSVVELAKAMCEARVDVSPMEYGTTLQRFAMKDIAKHYIQLCSEFG